MRLAYTTFFSNTSAEPTDSSQLHGKFVPLRAAKLVVASSVNIGSLTVGVRHMRFDPNTRRICVGAVGYQDGHTYPRPIGHLEGYAAQQLRTLIRKSGNIGCAPTIDRTSEDNSIKARGQSVLHQLDGKKKDDPTAAALHAAITDTMMRMESDHVLAKEEVLPLCDMGRSVFRYYITPQGKYVAIMPDKSGNNRDSSSFAYTDTATKTMRIQASDISIAYENPQITSEQLREFDRNVSEMQKNRDDKLATSLTTMPEYLRWLNYIRSEEQSGNYTRLFNISPDSSGRVPAKIGSIRSCIEIFYRDDTPIKAFDINNLLPEIYFTCDRELGYDSSILDSKMLAYARTSTPLHSERAPFRGLVVKAITTSNDEVFVVIWRMVQEDRTDVLNRLKIDPSARKEGDIRLRLTNAKTPEEMARYATILDELATKPDAVNQLPSEMFAVRRYPANGGNHELLVTPNYDANEKVPVEQLLAGTYSIVKDSIATTFYDSTTNTALYGFADNNTALIRVIQQGSYENMDEIVRSCTSDAFNWVRGQFSSHGRTSINGKKAWALSLVGEIPSDVKEEDIFVRCVPVRGVAETSPEALSGNLGAIHYNFVNSWWSLTPEEAMMERSRRENARNGRRVTATT